MAINKNLKVAFIHAGKSQRYVVGVLRDRGFVIDDTRLSKIVHGCLEATPEERREIARILRQPVTQLFPEVAA